MRALGFAVLLGIGGTMAGAIWTLALGLAGAPGAFLSERSRAWRDRGVAPLWGLFLTVLGQLYASLCFAAFIVKTCKHHLAGQAGPGVWIAWLVAFFVAFVPVYAAERDSQQASPRGVQHIAAPFTGYLAPLGFLLFAIWPRLTAPLWSWVPNL